jgi:hypothetical protein
LFQFQSRIPGRVIVFVPIQIHSECDHLDSFEDGFDRICIGHRHCQNHSPISTFGIRPFKSIDIRSAMIEKVHLFLWEGEQSRSPACLQPWIRKYSDNSNGTMAHLPRFFSGPIHSWLIPRFLIPVLCRSRWTTSFKQSSRESTTLNRIKTP